MPRDGQPALVASGRIPRATVRDFLVLYDLAITLT